MCRKTFTLLGEPGNEGLVYRSVQKLFEAKREAEELSRGDTQVELSVELLEIYNEKVRDLLAPNSGPDGHEIVLKVTSNEVVGNMVLQAENEKDVAGILDVAQKRRCVKATASNAVSSRSHMLFTIHFNVTSKSGVKRSGRLNICDLAGSERLGKSQANAHVGVSRMRFWVFECCLSLLMTVQLAVFLFSGSVVKRNETYQYFAECTLQCY
jgi:Kinesin motor domain